MEILGSLSSFFSYCRLKLNFGLFLIVQCVAIVTFYAQKVYNLLANG